jgi:hypothetical protein
MSLNITTTCKALNWIASKAIATGSDEFEGEAWDIFIFRGTLNRKMVREIRSWIDANNLATAFHMDHFVITLDGVKYEFDCRMPVDAKADYNPSYFHISRYK